ncbi:MAG: T9SS C-terminal target domain-containing protein [Flavobacteriales bacterium]|nr:T9SS C-terminal target domain-containing protein [Flavobacteriales bacterium]
MKSFKIIVLLFVFGQLKIFAQSFDPNLSADLQYTIDSFRTAYNLKGISASVYVPNQGTWQGVTGESHSGVPITPQTGFGIASNTKLFAGVLLLKLAENGLLSLDDSLYHHLPTFNNVDSTITVRQLLNHTSGLSDVNIAGYPDSMLADPNRVFTPTEIITWVGPPLSAPGTDWYYCNTNYLLAGMIAESVSGQSFSQLLRDSILTPLQLDSTYLAVYESSSVVAAHPWQGGMDFSSTPRTSINSAAWSAGAMYSTSGEMAQWYKSLMNGEVLNQNSLNEMTTFVGLGSYGVGISESTILGRTIWQHGGTIWGGYNSSMMYDVQSGSVICVLINQLPAQAFQVAIQLLTDLVSNSVGFPEQNMKITEIYPNPTSEKVKIDLKDADVIFYEVNSNNGSKLFEGTLTKDENEISFSLLAQGVYFITLKSSVQSEVFKVIRN